MLNEIKCCNIIYGYTDNCIQYYNNSTIILVEPRKRIIDKINKLKLQNVILIKKVLVSKNSLSEKILYHDKINDKYWLDNDDLSINGTNFFNINKEMVYTTSLLNLIIKYKIQNINNLVLNIDINNKEEILDSVEQFNHIISYIKTTNNFTCNLFNNFYKENDQKQGCIVFVHKNLTINLPKIGIYFNNLTSNFDIDKLTLLLNQYQMSLIVKESYSNNKKTNIIEHPDSINKLKELYINNIKQTFAKNNENFYEKIISNLDMIFNKISIKTTENENITENNKITGNRNITENRNVINKEIKLEENLNFIKSDDINLDIIIQFNHKYFEVNNTLQIMYPLKNDIIYINKVYDIIYATKSCMYMLYQIIKSKYFSDYLENKKKLNPKLFKMMSKRYFYEYIDKIFSLKYF